MTMFHTQTIVLLLLSRLLWRVTLPLSGVRSLAVATLCVCLILKVRPPQISLLLPAFQWTRPVPLTVATATIFVGEFRAYISVAELSTYICVVQNLTPFTIKIVRRNLIFLVYFTWNCPRIRQLSENWVRVTFGIISELRLELKHQFSSLLWKTSNYLCIKVKFSRVKSQFYRWTLLYS